MFIYLTTDRFTLIGGQDPIPYNPSESQVLPSCSKLLDNLGTAYLDSYHLSPLGVGDTYNVRILASPGKARKVQVVKNWRFEWGQKSV